MLMNRWLFALGCLAATVSVPNPPRALAAPQKPEARYEVLSPWAEVDPIPLRGISPRLENLSGKKIGLFVNYKRAARPIAQSLERRLRAMYSDSEIRYFYSLDWNVLETETRNRDKFAAWAREVDAAVLVVGD